MMGQKICVPEGQCMNTSCTTDEDCTGGQKCCDLGGQKSCMPMCFF